MMMVVRMFTHTLIIKANAVAYNHVSHNLDIAEWYPFKVMYFFKETYIKVKDHPSFCVDVELSNTEVNTHWECQDTSKWG